MGGVVVLKEIGGGDDFVPRVTGGIGGDGDLGGGGVGGGVGNEAEGDPVAVVGVIGLGAFGAVALDDAPVEAVGAVKRETLPS